MVDLEVADGEFRQYERRVKLFLTNMRLAPKRRAGKLVQWLEGNRVDELMDHLMQHFEPLEVFRQGDFDSRDYDATRGPPSSHVLVMSPDVSITTLIVQLGASAVRLKHNLAPAVLRVICGEGLLRQRCCA